MESGCHMNVATASLLPLGPLVKPPANRLKANFYASYLDLFMSMTEVGLYQEVGKFNSYTEKYGAVASECCLF